jgi:hypothetical protein
MNDWQVVIEEHHPGYIGWVQYLANRARLTANRGRAAVNANSKLGRGQRGQQPVHDGRVGSCRR